MNRFAYSFFFVCGCAVVAACSSEPTSSGGAATPPDAGASASAPSPEEGDANAEAPDASMLTDDCAPPENEAPYVDVESVQSDPPAMTGGTIADGTYFLMRFAVYTGPDGGTVPVGSIELQATLLISGGKGQFVDNQSGPSAWTFITSGSDLIIRHTCPEKYDSKVRYTATASTFAFSFDQNGYPLVETFTKQ